MKNLIKKFFLWLFKEEIEKEQQKLFNAVNKADQSYRYFEAAEKRMRNMLDSFDVSVDVNVYDPIEPSWAVISIQGERADFIRFYHLGNNELREIKDFLMHFRDSNRMKIDSSPDIRRFLKDHTKTIRINR